MCVHGRSSIQLLCTRAQCSIQLHSLLHEVSTRWANAVAKTVQFMGHVVIMFESRYDDGMCKIVFGELTGPHTVSIINNDIGN